MMINTSKNGRILRRRKTGVKEDVSGVKTVFNKTGARFLLAFLLLITFFSGYAAGVDSFSVSSTSEGYKAEQVIEKQLDRGVPLVSDPGVVTVIWRNYPPNTPKQPSGTSSDCRVGASYIYSTLTTDPNGDQIMYTFNWGDKSSYTTTGYIASGVTASAAHTWTKPETYQVEVMATDSKGAKSGWSTSLAVKVVNTPPDPPRKPSGPSSGQAGISYTYSTSADDPDGDQVKYIFDWGDVEKSTTSFVNSGDEASISHIWTEPETYDVKAQAEDSNRAKSDRWSTVLTVIIENTPPDRPSAPSGPHLGHPGISYTYYASTADPNGDQITYVFDWGDGNTSMTEAVGSGETVFRPHEWAKSGEYSVRVNATDANDASSEWSEPWVVVVGTEEQIPPIAIIAVDPTELNESEIVSLSADESSDQNGEIVSYEWDFGDGSTGTGVNVDHVYTRSGEYTATLMVTDNDDLSTTNRVDITVRAPPDDPLNMRPTANATINLGEPVEGTSVTFEGRGVDEDGEVVECRWIFPDGQIRSYSGSSSSFTLEDAPAGEYRFAVMDDAGAWSEEDAVNLLYSKSKLPILVIIALLAIAAIVAVVYWYFRIRPEPDTNGDGEFGSISVTSNPDGATVLLDGVDKGKSQLQMDAVSVGSHIVLFTKSGYSDCEKKAVVTANETTPVHCDLETKAPVIKLVLSAEPTELPADGKSKSVITIGMEDKNGVPIPVPEETEITLETNIGLIDTPVSIPAGDAQATSILTSSTAGGTATVRAKSGTGLKDDVAVRFV
jgi:PKD repeat protein